MKSYISNRNFSGLSGIARKHPHNFSGCSVRAWEHSLNILPDALFLTCMGLSCGGSFNEITGHCYLTVKRPVFKINNQLQSTLSVIGSWLSQALLPWLQPFFSRKYIK